MNSTFSFFMSVLCLLTLTHSANAAAPQIRAQAPGYYRFMVGDIEVTTLNDGTFSMKPSEVLKNVKPSEMTKFLSHAHEGQAIATSVNGFLINTGSKLVLIDTGAGTFMGPTVGHLMDNLKAAGYQPEQVDEIYLTHMHSDHLGGLTTDGKRNFTQAVVRADKKEAAYWLNPSEAEHVTNPMLKSMFTNATNTLGVYQSADKFKPFDGETELVPGVHAHPAFGHTPGHTVYSIESKNEKLWLVGDMIHVAAVQFPSPMTVILFDWNSKLAAAERMKDFDQVAKAGDLLGAAHLSFPGVGHLRKVGTGFAYTPMTYKTVLEANPKTAQK